MLKIAVTFISHSQLAVFSGRPASWVCTAGVCEPSPEVRKEKRVVYCPQYTGRQETGSTVAQSAAAHGVSQHAATSSSSSSSSWQNRGSSKTPSRLSGNYAPLPFSARPAEWRTYTAGFSPLHHVLPSPFLSHSLVSTMPPRPSLSSSHRLLPPCQYSMPE